MKKILDWLKSFKYKVVSTIALLIITQLIFWLTGIVWVTFISAACLIFLIIKLFMGIYYGIKNSYKDGDKGFAITVAIIAIAMAIFILFLTISFL